MFRRSDKVIEKQIAEKLINIVGVNTRIDGTLTARGNVRIDGILVGKLNSAARLIIGLTGFIDGKINCKNADILGTVKGFINGSNLIRLKESAKIEGVIKCKRIIIDKNVIIKTGYDFNKTYFKTNNTATNNFATQQNKESESLIVEEKNKLKILNNYRHKKNSKKQKTLNDTFENYTLNVDDYDIAKQ